MNKVALSLLLSLFVVSVVAAASPRPYYFNMYRELLGTWKVAKTTTSISTGAVIEETTLSAYNVTKNDIPQELVLNEVTVDTMEEIRKPYQIIVSVSSNLTAAVNHFEPGAEEEIKKILDIHFNEFLHNEVFVRAGALRES